MRFEELLQKIRPKLKGICHRLNGRYTYFNDDDLFQEAAIHLWQDFSRGKLSDKTDSYILQGCYFHLKNYIRTAKVRNHVSLEATLYNDSQGSSLEEILIPQDEKHKDYLQDLHNRYLTETIFNNGFTKKEKDILALYVQGLTVREIGRKQGISHVMVLKIMNKVRLGCAKYIDKI